ncbi:MAG TPA: branched-chain amino acid ABC transporter permease/ATP-binding protein [Streptosporangiaceae bacterium]|nr:branched-chain amino acid ABC transporter permease/ATP-binding protein [Streptosporangiaceae bacterium]
MQQILLFILLGLGSGALIAGIALAVVLSYRGSGIINLSTGAIAMLGGYAFWALNAGKLATLPTAVALPLSLLFVLAVGAITEFAVYRPLRNSSPLAKLVSSLGVLLIAQSAMILAFGVTPQPEPGILPTNVVHIFGAVVPIDRFILTGIVIVAAAGLAALYKWTRFGLATRAASENEAAAMLSGLSPNVISLVNTLLAALLAGALGILAASITQLDPETLPLQIIPALAAALIAAFTSFGIAVAASFGIGIMDSLIQYASAQSWFPQSGGVSLPGVTDLLAFLIIVVVLFWRGSRIPGRGEIVERRLPEAPRPQHLVRTGLICALAGAVLLIVFPFDFREALINTLIGALMALSLVVVTGFVGQISVIQLALAGAAGFTISHMAVNFGLTFPVAALAGIAVAVVIGLLTAISAVRVRGVSLSVVTLAGAVAIENFGFVNSTWGGGLAGSPVPEPTWFGLDLGPNAPFRGIDGNQPSPVFGWVALICCVLLMVAVGYIRRGKLGQRMLAVRSNERAAAAAAINPRTVKLYAFGIAAGIAGVGGVLYAYNFGSVSADRFDAVTALSLIAFAYAGGITLITGALFAGLLSAQALIPYALDKWFGLNGNWFLLVGGVLLIFTLLRNPEGVAGDFYRRTHKRPEIRAPDVPASSAPARSAQPAPARSDLAGGPAVLRVTGLSVAFGGVHALSDVSLEVREGELVGLIGPNGAGKTTLVDAVSGFVGYTGRVELSGADISGLPPYERARRGLGRTWQSTELFDDLDVRENLTVAVRDGTGARDGSAGPTLALVGMGWAAEAMPAQLSMGQRKLVGVARALAAKPRLLCLDEPAAGLDTRESAELGACLRGLADQGQPMLLIEHDMGLVLGICDRVVVLEFGQVIADGPPEAVRTDPRVIAAYLGQGVTSEGAPAFQTEA